MNRADLERRARLWQRHHASRAVALSCTAGFAAACFVVRSSPVAAVALGVTILMCVLVFLRRRAQPVMAATVAAHLNRLCPSLEESAALWLSDPDMLTLVERLQLRRLNLAWEALAAADRETLGSPRAGALRPAAALGTAAATALVIVVSWPRAIPPSSLVMPVAPRNELTMAKSLVPALRSAALVIESPAYLGELARRVTGLDAEVAEGSVVTWILEISGDVTSVTLDGADAKERTPTEALGGGRFRARATIVDTRLYQLAVTRVDGGRVLWPDLHTLKAIRDQPPRLVWQEPALSRTIIDPAGGRPVIAVRVGAVDDHGIRDVKLIMTVAKGSGEGVKFREQEIALEPATDTTANSLTFGRQLDLGALGLEPGDELYFHAVASDRRMPAPNVTRSETRFVVLRGPTTELAAPGLAIAGINRVPQYFRSQRQLIIDTERLLSERLALTDEKFRERSEDIGVDQKLLRLRYGQFLGEEFEPASIGAPREAQSMANAGVLRGQPREAANRTAAVERAVEAQHVHPTAPNREGRPPTLQEIMAPYVHQHDNAEAATLFDERVKAALRGVLGAMWEAEGFLRTGQPAEALPAENRALELLKALQEADRVYVKRIGYEPAPLAVAERRLRGELEAIPKTAREEIPSPERNAGHVALATGLTALGELALARLPAETAALVDARLVAAAQERPETFIAALEIWRRKPTVLSVAEQTSLRTALWSLLPPARETPRRAPEPAPGLARIYFDTLSANAGREQ